MDNRRQGWSRMAIAVRVAVVALVLLCATPYKMEAHAPVPASGVTGAPLPGLSAADWAAIQARLAQAGAHAPLVTGQVAKLTADDGGIQDYLGHAVSISGDTVVVGAYGDDDGAINAGAAYVFERNYDPDNPSQPSADNWGQVAKLIAADPAETDYFGRSVSISGDTVVVGASLDDDGGNDSGSAYIFERNKNGADSWGQVAKLTAGADASAGAGFGWSVAISGDTVVVGAHRHSGLQGAAYVFERNRGGADDWGQVAKLTASDATTGVCFGDAVAISGDTVAVGTQEGESAYVFERNQGGANNWGEVKSLIADDNAANDGFGRSVGISGDTVIVGAPYDDDGGDVSGSAYVFGRNQGGADNWGQVEKLTAVDGAEGDQFGRSVTISGDTIVVGAWYDDDTGSSSGSAYIFERNRGGADEWGQTQKLVADDGAEFGHFGHSVAISGNAVLVGADGHNFAQGSAYVFARQGATWAQQQKPIATDATANDVFGTSVAISGDILIGGAPGNDDSGSAYLVYRNQDGADQWGQVRKKHTGALPPGAAFGTSVAIDVDTAAVGAPDADRAYIFERNGSGADLWGHVKTLTGTTAAGFGNAVSISGDTAVAGAPYDGTACSNCGAAYVYERNYDPGNPGTPLADNWGLRAVLTAPVDPASGDQFGWSVSISGDTVVVGAPYDSHSGKNQVGSVYVFKRNYDPDNPTVPKADNWGLVRNLQVDDVASGDHFGQGVAISGDTFVVGAPLDDSGAGSIYVFERNHDWPDGWGQVQKLAGDDTVGGDWFGWSVGIGGDTLVVGAPYDDDGGDGSGSAYLFERNEGGTDNWGQVEKLTAGDGAADDEFGWSVSISGNTVAVGARYDDDGGDGSGSAYVFRWTAAAVYLPFALKD